MWASEFAEHRKANPSALRMGRIANALAMLRGDLSGMLRDSRAVNSDNDFSLTEGLLDLVAKHQPIVDAHGKTRGRVHDRATNLAGNIGKLVISLSGHEHVTKALDAFVATAMAWLSQNTAAEDAAFSRNRRRRAGRAAR